mgnify:CR=1 FL=1
MNEPQATSGPTDDNRQTQFLQVIDRDEATRRFQAALRLLPLEPEDVLLADSLGRVLAVDVVAEVDVPAFDRSNMDGFAVQSADTHSASEETPRFVSLNAETLSPGAPPTLPVVSGTATPIATGGMLPRGADAVVRLEAPDLDDTLDPPRLQIPRNTAAGQNVTFAGTDIARGETVLRAGEQLTSREIGVLAAIGVSHVRVTRRPRVGIISTGDEIVPPGQPLPAGCVFDSNAAILASAVSELGAEPVLLGTAVDNHEAIATALERALQCDVALLSGGTSKGAGDLSYRAVSQMTSPGIVAHGVSLKPGKPICLAAHHGKPVVILPGFPTSAIFTFHEFVAPVLRILGNIPTGRSETRTARLPVRINSERGRTEFALVGLIQHDDGLVAYPMGKGSGSVTTFSKADGFITIDRHTEQLQAGATVTVRLLGRELQPADLVSIGSHCVGLDFLLGRINSLGLRSKVMHVGSLGGLAAAERGECDLAGMHLMDPKTGEYNRPFLKPGLRLCEGYRRLQGIAFRSNDNRFTSFNVTEGDGVPADLVELLKSDPGCHMINRNPGSGTRILVDRLLSGARPAGYLIQPKAHNAVAAAIAQGRADWGMTIATVARAYGLGFIPVQEEHYDFAIPEDRWDRPAVVAFRELLTDESVRSSLRDLGFRL